MASDRNQDTEDEYVPIDHVLGPDRKRIRLLKPYVLRLRRHKPFQAYMLRRIETVRGLIANSYDKNPLEDSQNSRLKRELKSSSIFKEDGSNSFVSNSFRLNNHDIGGRESYTIKVQGSKHPLSRNTSKETVAFREINNFEHPNICYKHNDSLNAYSHSKRQIKDVSVNFEKGRDDPNTLSWHQIDDNQIEKSSLNQYKSNKLAYNKKNSPFHEVDYDTSDGLTDRMHKVTKVNSLYSNSYDVRRKNSHSLNTIQQPDNADSFISYNAKSNKLNGKKLEINNNVARNINIDRNFIIYEICDPDLWFKTQVQLLEKINTPDGKSIWNDLTKGEKASVSSTKPEWSNQDVYIQYKPDDLLAREDLTLPLKGLCLLLPLKDDNQFLSVDKSGEFIVVPMSDVVTLDDFKGSNKRDLNYSNVNKSALQSSQRHRRVMVRTVRALMGGSADSLNLVTRGSNKYLMLPHTKTHNAQINVEARADDNVLVIVGLLGRLTTIVSDSTRTTRSILTVQATNTGLAAARFRVFIREGTPKLVNRVERDETISDAILLPPQHFHNFHLNLPIEIPFDSVKCIVTLLNEDDKSVAVRDVRIKRDDRCYCVWRCDCVCLSEDPKLLCREMTSAQVLAAGLSVQKKLRHSRSVCYPDLVTLNIFVTFIGVLLALLLLGLIKAILGLVLRYVGSCGIQLLLQTPRKINRYYESSLKNRTVIYDIDGWPVHPDTKDRTVRLVSKPVEFVLNLIFFISLPCLMIWDAIKKMATRCQTMDEKSDTRCRKNENKKCFSTHDVQGMQPRYRRRRGRLYRWMTPEAEQLATGIWRKGLSPPGTKSGDCLQPLLREDKCFRNICDQSSIAGSEQDDTEYVLMQMKKSRESLARSKQQMGSEK